MGRTTYDGVSPGEYVEAASMTGKLASVTTIIINSGEVCKIRGHVWRAGRPGEGECFQFADYHPGTEYRTCVLCGACQMREQGGWK